MTTNDDSEEDTLSPQEEAEKAAVFAEFQQARGQRQPKIELGELLDLIDDNNWGEYACRYSLDQGLTWAEGSVQSDGHLIAAETLTDNAGDLVANKTLTRFFPAPGEQSPTTAQKPRC